MEEIKKINAKQILLFALLATLYCFIIITSIVSQNDYSKRADAISTTDYMYTFRESAHWLIYFLASSSIICIFYKLYYIVINLNIFYIIGSIIGSEFGRPKYWMAYLRIHKISTFRMNKGLEICIAICILGLFIGLLVQLCAISKNRV